MTFSGAANRLRIVVLGYIVRGPVGGLAWHHLQYVMGLARLGHDVYFVEDSEDFPACYNPVTNVTSTDATYGLHFIDRVFKRVGLADRWAYFDAHGTGWVGPCAARIADILRTADLVLNLSGMTPLRPWILDVSRRAFVDTDPVFMQIQHLVDSYAREIASAHNSFFSFAENIGQPGCEVPLDGFPWQPTRQPVLLDVWPAVPPRPHGRFTTVMLWTSYAPAEYQGRRYGMKSQSFDEYLDLPGDVGRILELTVGSKTAPRELLKRKGWLLRKPGGPSRTPWTYQRYIQQSKAEFSVAKHGYVIARSGWFSERSACYLASGRPVVTEETGFSQWLAASQGVLSFRDREEARRQIEEVNERYEEHCRAAREVAEEYFDAGKVLTRLIDLAMYPVPLSGARA